MRVQVSSGMCRGLRFGALAGGILVTAAASIWADNILNFGLHGFQDSRTVTVLAPVFDLARDFTDRSSLKATFGVDAVTAASDSCARCHPEGANNHRTYLDASYRRKYGDYKLEVGGEISRENFYAADTLSASVSRDLNKGNTTIAGGYSFSYNRPQLHPSADVEHQVSQEAYVTLTQTLTKGTVVQLTYDFSRISGYQSNPFLRTPVNGIMVVGNAPDSRSREALALRLRQALPADTYLEADYRRYWDSWAIDSNTLEIGLSHYFTPSFLLGGSYRWYDQTGAFFYEPSYTGNPEYFTGDFRLAPFTSGLYGGRLSYAPAHGLLGVFPAHTALDVRYERYIANTNFEAAIFSAGLRIPF
jgi:hypothetical protein